MPVSQATRFGEPKQWHRRQQAGADAFLRLHKWVLNKLSQALKKGLWRFPQPQDVASALLKKQAVAGLFSTSINVGAKVVFHIFHRFPQAFLTFLWKTPQFSTTSIERSASLWKTQIFPQSFQKVFHNTET